MLFEVVTPLLRRVKLFQVNFDFNHLSGVTIEILLSFIGQHSDIGCARHELGPLASDFSYCAGMCSYVL